MKLEEKITDSYKAEKARETSERIGSLMREGLDCYEKAFKSKFVDMVYERYKHTTAKCDPVEFRDYSLGERCDKFLKEKLKYESKRREEYYVELGMQSQAKDDEDGTLMPPLAMVPKIVYFSEMKKLFAGLSLKEQDEISGMFKIKREDMPKVIDHFHKIRNSRSHDQGQFRNPRSTFCLEKFIGPSKIDILHKGKTDSLNLNKRLFGSITLLGHMLSELPYENTFQLSGEWRHKMVEQLIDLPPVVLGDMGFKENWKDHRIWQQAKVKSIQGIGAMHSIDLGPLRELYEKLNLNQKHEIDMRTKLISNKLIEKGYNTSGGGMDNYEWTARACVMRSVLGFEDEGYGFPNHELDRARAMANGSEDKDELLNVLNDHYAGKVFNDSVWVYIPKGASDRVIIEKIDRWMRFDKKRRDSDFHKSFLLMAVFSRMGGPKIFITNIYPAYSPGFFSDIVDDQIHDFKGTPSGLLPFLQNRSMSYEDKMPEWLKKKNIGENMHKSFDICRNALMTKIGEKGIIEITYSQFAPWPSHMIVNLDKANSDFKKEIEEGYKFRDPEAVGCNPYYVPFVYPFMLEKDMEEKLNAKLPSKNPFDSVDSILRYSHEYYSKIIEKKFFSKINSVKNGRLSIELSYKKLIAESSRNFKVTFHVKIVIGNIYNSEWNSIVPLEVEVVNGQLHLNTRKMQLNCSRDADIIIKKIIRKIMQKGTRV